MLSKIYYNYKVNLNDLKAGNTKLLNSKVEKDLSPQEIKEAVEKWDLSNPNAKDKILISKINEAEAKQLQKEFNFKGNYPLAREIDAQHIAHALKNHGDEATELARGQIAITKDEIFINYPSITKTYDKRILTLFTLRKSMGIL